MIDERTGKEIVSPADRQFIVPFIVNITDVVSYDVVASDRDEAIRLAVDGKGRIAEATRTVVTKSKGGLVVPYT